MPQPIYSHNEGMKALRNIVKTKVEPISLNHSGVKSWWGPLNIPYLFSIFMSKLNYKRIGIRAKSRNEKTKVLKYMD